VADDQFVKLAAGGNVLIIEDGGAGDVGLTNQIAGKDFFAAHIQPAFGTPAYGFNVAAHALVGCGASVASGGSCQSGALSGGVSAAAGPLTNGPNYARSLVANAVVGGVASVAGGGKFANGAITGAFGYMFNAAAQSLREPSKNEVVIVINNNGGGGIGTHAGMFVGDQLFDPGGSYMDDRTRFMSAEERDEFVPTLNDYAKYHSTSGGDVRIYRYDLNDEDMSTISKRVDQSPGGVLFCANSVQTCIAGVGPFEISTPWRFTMTFPSTLATRLQGLPTGNCTKYGGGAC